jgi:NAD(P)-dependent dehydrogenase (short-subunit alcohol dehydrogenase family)
MGKLEGKIALITGGSTGIGLATAKQFVNEGAHVFVTGRREAELTAAAKQIGRNATGVQGDVSDLGDLDRLFAQIKREQGRLDIVFANAGVAKYAPLGAITQELYDAIFDTNVKGLLFTVQKALPLMPDGSAIILVVARELGLPEDIVNVEGGAVAHGHPIGATGAVLTTKLIHSMRRDGLRRGLVTLGIGGGQGIALAIEVLH